ncbi:regulator [Escherichia coli]|uniref:regulator n=1 Tax=Escherichia coli TaxID=562 RepID=UPI001F220D23|nr:regulator [Escherichia coli]MCF7287027.1 regulator [Escherichia coli]HDL8913369.1 regulator [Escherichia coli]
MRPNISITLTTPHVTIERYSELTGLSIDTINDMLADGRLIRHRLRKDKKREKVMINIAAMTVDALSECNLNLNSFDSEIHQRH